MESLTVEIDEEARVATVTLTGPGKGNAMGPEFWGEMPAAIDELDANENVRAIVLRGAGDHFSYGLDLQRHAPMFMGMFSGDYGAKQRTEFRKLVTDWQNAATCLEKCSKPVIAAVHGYCLGGGIDLITAADWRLCSATATFGVREVRVAITADIGTLQRLPRIVGEGTARRLALTGQDFDAQHAFDIGLVEQVYESNEALFAAAHAEAVAVAKNSPLVVAGTKEVMNRTREMTVEQGLDYVVTWNSAFLASKDLQEAMLAYMERREPNYTGE